MLGSFLTDFRNSRGKFDEIKEEFAINPATIPSESSLNAGGHDELKIFLEIRLIPSRIDQKLKNKRGKYMGFKEKLGPKSWPLEAVVGVGLMRRGDDSMASASWLQFREKLAGIWLQFSVNQASIPPRYSPRSRHDRATIGRQS